MKRKLLLIILLIASTAILGISAKSVVTPTYTNADVQFEEQPTIAFQP